MTSPSPPPTTQHAHTFHGHSVSSCSSAAAPHWSRVVMASWIHTQVVGGSSRPTLLIQPLEHLQVPVHSGVCTRPRGPQASILLRPLQHLQVPGRHFYTSPSYTGSRAPRPPQLGARPPRRMQSSTRSTGTRAPAPIEAPPRARPDLRMTHPRVPRAAVRPRQSQHIQVPTTSGERTTRVVRA